MGISLGRYQMKKIIIIVLAVFSITKAERLEPLFFYKEEIKKILSQNIYVNRHRAKKLEVTNKMKGPYDQWAQEIIKYLDGNGYKKYDNNERKLLNIITIYASHENKNGAHLIRNEKVFLALLECLQVVQGDEKLSLVGKIGRLGHPTLKQKYRDRLKMAIPEMSDVKRLSEGMYLTKAEEKYILLNKEKYPDQVRAIVGDKKAEARIIESFENAREYNIIKKIAYALAKIGSKNAQVAIVKRLNDGIIDSIHSNKTHIRYELIKALGEIYPDNELFHISFEKETIMGAFYEQRKNEFIHIATHESVKTYLENIAFWSEKTLGIKPDSALEEQPFIHVQTSLGLIE
jgi:hypothetical protein